MTQKTTASKQFNWEIHGYFRYPVVSKMAVTGNILGMLITIQDYSTWNNSSLNDIVVLRNKKIVFHIRRKQKDKWIRLI